MNLITEPPVDPDRIAIEFSALRVRQPIGDLYVAKMDFRQIEKITFFDVRRRIQEERDLERYLGIQRPLDLKRVEALSGTTPVLQKSFY